MTATGGMELDATPSILVVHTAVRYHRCQGLGIGLVQRVACAKTGRTKSDILETHKQGLKVEREEFAASKRNPHGRADMVALLKALHLANATVKKRWPQTTVPTTIVILLGRQCRNVMEIITNHIEHGPRATNFCRTLIALQSSRSSNASIRSGALVSRSPSRFQITTTRLFNLRRHTKRIACSSEYVTMLVSLLCRKLQTMHLLRP